MMNFKRLGFRRATHDKDGKFNEDANIWQAFVWNSAVIKAIGKLIKSEEAMSFKEIVEKCAETFTTETFYDDEDIALALINMIECGLAEIEPISDFETDMFDDVKVDTNNYMSDAHDKIWLKG